MTNEIPAQPETEAGPADNYGSSTGIVASRTHGRMPLEALGDVELTVEVVLGRARLRLHELLDARPGHALELDRSRNSPVDVLVNGTLFARGEMVLIDDSMLGVRITEVIGADLVEEARQ